MRQQGTDRYFAIEAALRELVRDVVRDELRYLREEILGWIQTHETPPPPANESSADELLTAAQVAEALQVVPGTVRSWIQSGALKASRPGNGAQPGRTYRVRRADLDAFVAVSEGRLASSCGQGWLAALLRSKDRWWLSRGRRGNLEVVLKLKAQVHQGRLKLDEPYDAPEGTEVDLAIVDDGDDLDDDERARLHAAIARGHEEAQRGEVVPADEVLAKLRRG